MGAKDLPGTHTRRAVAAWLTAAALSPVAARAQTPVQTLIQTPASADPALPAPMTVPEPPDGTPDSLVPVAPGAATISRRALLGTVGAGSLLLGVQGIAQDAGGPVRALAFMFPRGSTLGSGPNDFPVNGTFAALGLGQSAIADWLEKQPHHQELLHKVESELATLRRASSASQ